MAILARFLLMAASMRVDGLGSGTKQGCSVPSHRPNLQLV